MLLTDSDCIEQKHKTVNCCIIVRVRYWYFWFSALSQRLTRHVICRARVDCASIQSWQNVYIMLLIKSTELLMMRQYNWIWCVKLLWTASVMWASAVGVRVLCRWAHDVFCDICHQQANDDQHHANCSPHCCHGDHNVLHPRRRQGKLHTLVRSPRRIGAGVQADAVGDVFMQVGHEKVSASRSKMDAGTLKLSVAAVPPAAQLIASASGVPATNSVRSLTFLSC